MKIGELFVQLGIKADTAKLVAIQYIAFQGEYERAYVELNKPRE